MLRITNLCVRTNGETKNQKMILENINLSFESGKIYSISGQNGSGKSTLAQVLIGNPEYSVDRNSQIMLDGRSLIDMKPDERSQAGMFVSMQYPTEIPGVKLLEYLKIIVKINRKGQGLEKLTTKQTLDIIDSKLKQIGWSKEFLKRNLNEGMSGGERKKCEILQMLLLDPKLIILDEIDSGLDSKALDTVINVLQKFVTKDKTLILITHQSKILESLVPDQIIKIKAGKIC
jgi:Fe-S cluster assembly ATP-binding protein